MYKKETEGWLKHYDFILLDLICLHLVFVLAYAESGHGWNPYNDMLYRNMLILWLDLKILFRTVWVVLRRKGAS